MGSLDKSLETILKAKKGRESQGEKSPADSGRQELTSLGGRQKKNNAESLEAKVYPAEFIEKTITDILKSQEGISKVEKFKVEGNKISFIVTALTENKRSGVRVWVVLESASGTLKVRNCEAEDKPGKKVVEEKMGLKAKQIPELLKTHIENKEKKNVEKIEIANRELKVSFGTEPWTTKPGPQPETSPEPDTQPKEEKFKEEKAKRIAELKKIIENAENTITQNNIREKEILKRLAEIKVEKATAAEDEEKKQKASRETSAKPPSSEPAHTVDTDNREEVANKSVAELASELQGLENLLLACSFWQFKRKKEIKKQIDELQIQVGHAVREEKEKRERKASNY